MAATVTPIASRRSGASEKADARRLSRPFRDNPRLILAGIGVLLAVLVAILALASRTASFSPDFLTEFVLYALSAADLTMLVALAFVLARNIVKLWVERRRALLEGRLDLVGDHLKRRHAHRPLFTGLQQPLNQLLPIEPLARAVLLHRHVGDFVDPFVAGEALAALEAFAAAADNLAFFAFSRVDHFIAQMRAIRALHAD